MELFCFTPVENLTYILKSHRFNFAYWKCFGKIRQLQGGSKGSEQMANNVEFSHLTPQYLINFKSL